MRRYIHVCVCMCVILRGKYVWGMLIALIMYICFADDDHHHPERGKVCSYGGKDYEHGETWTAHGEHCTECTCSSDGVVSCQRLKCDVPEDCRVVRTEPNSCCPLCTAGTHKSHMWPDLYYN